MAPQKLKISYYESGDGDLVLESGDRPYVLKLRDLPAEEKPREKLVQFGPASLSVVELFAIILGVGTKKEDVLAMSRRLMKEYGENAVLTQKDPKKLSEFVGIPFAKACQVVACLELGKRFFEVSAHGKPVVIRTPGQAFEHLKDMKDLTKEHLRGLYLDNHYQLIHDEVISIGSVTANIVHPREVFRPALEYAASAIILAHNHPSGVTKPSDADLAVTQQIVEAGKIVGIAILDHLIIAKDKYESIPGDY